MLCGFPHFSDTVFNGKFPIAKIRFKDKDFPAVITLTAFNPFIPLDDKNSSLPAGFFDISIKNVSGEDLKFSTIFAVMNPNENSVNITIKDNQFSGVKMTGSKSEDDLKYCDMTVAANDNNVIIQNYWYRGGWQDNITTYLNELNSADDFLQRNYDSFGYYDHCALGICKTIKSGQTDKFKYILSWNVPNNYNYWKPYKDENEKDIIWKNYYATIFKDSEETARYCLKNWNLLYKKTKQFKDILHGATLDSCVIDAVSSNLSVLKSPTVLRLNNGSFYGWEGVNRESGSCEGTCQHVWNYAYALCFLFPKLERSIRDLEFKYNLFENGEMSFRMALPLGRKGDKFRACVDGQMGSVIKWYREWKICGDDKWLASNWENIKKILSYAWSDTNPDEWDRNKDGVLEGRQHHTLDLELFGPSSWLQGFYLAALKAASIMAEHLGDKEAYNEYITIYNRGYNWTKNNLFNGKYFIQKVDLKDRQLLEHFNAENAYWNDEKKEIKYQISEGSEIDQMCGQWHSKICGLGNIFDKEQIETALKNVYKYNFKTSMRDIANTWRVFSLNDESGAIICDYPEGTEKPAIPISYNSETMTGFEYQLAGLMISEGRIKEGLNIVKAIRERYNGKNRNPWNEFECGSNYARSMASYALIPIFSGFIFDLPNKLIGFNPINNKKDFKCIWSLDSGWGNFIIKGKSIKIIIIDGFLEIDKISLKFISSVSKVIIDGKANDFNFSQGLIKIKNQKITKNIIVFE